jgi:hypothetical protein
MKTHVDVSLPVSLALVLGHGGILRAAFVLFDRNDRSNEGRLRWSKAKNKRVRENDASAQFDSK